MFDNNKEKFPCEVNYECRHSSSFTTYKHFNFDFEQILFTIKKY